MELNVVLWILIIVGCVQNGKDIEVLELFREMQVVGVKLNCVIIFFLFLVCGNIVVLVYGRLVYGFVVWVYFLDDVYVGSVLIDMYVKCGRINMFQVVFDMMFMRNLVCWNLLMSGYLMYGKVKEVMSIFEFFVRIRLKFDFISFISLLLVCS